MVCVFTCGLLLSATKLYKWVDEKGQVHYSDKPHAAGQVEEQTLNSSNVPQVSIPTPLPINLPDARRVIFVANQPLFSQSLVARQQVGEYRFGQDCVSPTALNLSRFGASSPHHRMFPSATRLSAVAASQFIQKKLKATYQEAAQIKKNRELLDSTVIFEIAEATIVACNPKVRRDRRKGLAAETDPEQYRWYQFTQAQAYLKVNWWVQDPKGSLLFKGQTEASTSRWSKNTNVDKTVLKVFEQATQNLLSDSNFVAWLSSGQKEESLWSKITGSHSESQQESMYLTRAKIAQALSYMTQGKVMVAEYYMMEGEWPDQRLFAQGFDDATLLTEHNIETLNLLNDGSIQAYLNFSRPDYITLTPTAKGSMILWKCYTSLDSRFVETLNCEQE